MPKAPLLFLNVLIVAMCGLVYELLAGTLASYVLGDSVTQFSLIIGVYLSAMGVGAWLSRFVARSAARVFIEVELGVALIGGLSAPLLFLCFARLEAFRVILFGMVFLIGVLVGLELPLLMRILRDQIDFKELVSRALAFDYLGALAASLLFPLFLVPNLGLIRSSLAIGLVNAAVGLWGTWLLAPLLGPRVSGLRARSMVVIVLLGCGILKADALTHLAESDLYAGPVVHAESSAYQRIVVTGSPTGFQLYLNGNLQFDSSDEYRYHEALVQPALSCAVPRRVLILGGGDGLAAREVLRDERVESVTLVDLDPAVTRLAQEMQALVDLNQGALRDPRVTVVNRDAMRWLREGTDRFDLVIIDFPDPNNYSLGKLYTTHFYRLLRARLTDDGVAAIQCTSPRTTRNSYWCIIKTLRASGFEVHPYHATVPSFGIWGYALVGGPKLVPPRQVRADLRYLNDAILPSLFHFPEDMGPVPVEVTRLNNQILVHYYEDEERKLNWF